MPVHPHGFAYLQEVDSSIAQKMRYAGNDNIIGWPAFGYLGRQCIVTHAAAEALVNVQRKARMRSLGLKVYDADPSKKASNSFMAWCAHSADTPKKKHFYPSMAKSFLVSEGYLVADSIRARDSTVDVTLAPLLVPLEPMCQERRSRIHSGLPHGERFDDDSINIVCGYGLFEPKANTFPPSISLLARVNRLILCAFMQRHGFAPCDREGWRFSPVNGPLHGAFDFHTA